MMVFSQLLILLITLFSSHTESISLQDDAATIFLRDYEREFLPYYHQFSQVMYDYSTNITKENAGRQKEVIKNYILKMKALRKEASKINLTNADWSTKRQFGRLIKTTTTKNVSISKEIIETATEMYEIYNTGTIPFNATLIKSMQVENETENLK